MRSFTALRSGSSAYEERLENCRSARTATHTVAIPIVSTATLERAKQLCGAMDGALLDYTWGGHRCSVTALRRDRPSCRPPAVRSMR